MTLPPQKREVEVWVGGGMGVEFGLVMGLDVPLEMTSTFGGPMRDMLRQYGVTKCNCVYLRFVGAYQQDDTSAVDNIEVIVRGRHSEIDMGDQEVGEASEFKVTSVLSYYKLVWNGRTEIEIDPLNMIEIVNGIDLLAEQRNALGIF